MGRLRFVIYKNRREYPPACCGDESKPLLRNGISKGDLFPFCQGRGLMPRPRSGAPAKRKILWGSHPLAEIPGLRCIPACCF